MTDPIPRLNAALEGRYRIERELGAGGMATVYLADDLRHGRKVAIKVLKPELAAVIGAERFLAEIRTTANLQHPHILPLFDSGDADGFLYYVMPFVEGESLRERLDRETQLPVAEAVSIAGKVAGALHLAHEQGVVHRDIKPANILLANGEPLVADFGIALAVTASGGSRLTETGLSLGTPHYMSPEQATGEEYVGPTADIYALGCVLFETLTGEPPFTGSSPQAILGKILVEEAPDAAAVRKSVPPNVAATARRALEKVPADRFPKAIDFARALGDKQFRHGREPATVVAATEARWKVIAFVLAGLSVTATAVAMWSLQRPEPTRSVERYAAAFGDGTQPTYTDNQAFALSPDGLFLVYRGVGGGASASGLWIRRWSDLDPAPIRGAQGGVQPAASPSGDHIAFVRVGEVYTVPAEGGVPTPLMEATRPYWARDGYIYGTTGPIVRVPEGGGAVETVTQLRDGEFRHRLIDIAPGGSLALVVADVGPRSEIRALRMDSGEMVALVEGSFPRFAGSGHIVFLAPDGTLMAARFDARALQLLGQPMVVANDIEAFSLADNGRLFYTRAGAQETELVWVTRTGRIDPVDDGWTFNAGAGNIGWSLSPDGTRAAIRVRAGDNDDIWVKELDDGPLSRLTFDAGQDWSPLWAPDGESITFVSIRGGDRDVWSKRADGSGDVELVYDHPSRVVEGFYSPDGEWLVVRGGQAGAASGTRDILALRVGIDSVARPLLVEDYDERQPTVSPDGRWIAYTSNETGIDEIFVRPFPLVDEGRWQISSDGGRAPLWARSGQELLFIGPEDEVISTRISVDPEFTVVSKESLFTLPSGVRTSVNNTVWGIDPSGERFLMGRRYEGSAVVSESPFILINGFSAELERLLPD